MSEVERADSATAAQPATVVEVDLHGQRHRLAWPRGQSLVDTMLDAGIEAPHSDREDCVSCVTTVVSGAVHSPGSPAGSESNSGTSNNKPRQ